MSQVSLPQQTSPGTWGTVQAALRARLSESDYAAWLAPMEFQGLQGNDVTITVPTTFMRDWITKNFQSLVTETIAAEWQLPLPPTLKLIVNPAVGKSVSAAITEPAPAVTENTPVNELPRLDPRYTFNTFVTGTNNQLAYAAAERVSTESGQNPMFRPFFIHGKVGLGKTHLMQAIGWEVHRRTPKAKIVYVSSGQFINDFVSALRDKNIGQFKDSFKNIDLLMVDDIQFLAGKESSQQEFFNIFNEMTMASKQVILTADRSPHELDAIEERLKSRFGSGLTVEVKPPEVETRLAILQRKAADMNITLTDDVLKLLAHTIASNVRELEGALNRLVAASRLLGTTITADFARDQLADLFRVHQRVVSIDDIQQKTVEFFKIKMSDLHSPSRVRDVARPRQIAMYLCKKLTTRSYPDIGRAFGGRDHTTVMHAVETIENLIARDADLAENVSLLKAMLK